MYFQAVRAKGGLPTVARSDREGPTFALRAMVGDLRLTRERRLVDQTGIEPVTS